MKISTPTDLLPLFDVARLLSERASKITTAKVTVAMILEACGAGCNARISFTSDKTGGHSISESVDYVEEIAHAIERFTAHANGFFSEQGPKLVTPAGLAWGAKPDFFEAPALWGTRAILDQRSRFPLLDILWDRQDDAGPAEAKKALHARLNGEDGKPGALPALREAFADGRIGETDGENTHAIVSGVEFVYRTAGGYCYLCARLTDLPDTISRKAKLSRKAVR